MSMKMATRQLRVEKSYAIGKLLSNWYLYQDVSILGTFTRSV